MKPMFKNYDVVVHKKNNLWKFSSSLSLSPQPSLHLLQNIVSGRMISHHQALPSTIASWILYSRSWNIPPVSFILPWYSFPYKDTICTLIRYFAIYIDI